MSLSEEEVRRVAHLARIGVRDEEIAGYAQDLSGILDLVEQMNGVDTTGVPPMAHPQETTQRLRPDEVTETDQRERFQSIAPATGEGLYLVPKVIE